MVDMNFWIGSGPWIVVKFLALSTVFAGSTPEGRLLSVPQDRPRSEATQVMKSSSDDTATFLARRFRFTGYGCGQFQFHINKETMLIEISTHIYIYRWIWKEMPKVHEEANGKTICKIRKKTWRNGSNMYIWHMYVIHKWHSVQIPDVKWCQWCHDPAIQNAGLGWCLKWVKHGFPLVNPCCMVV